jgi:hypothetical protein
MNENEKEFLISFITGFYDIKEIDLTNINLLWNLSYNAIVNINNNLNDLNNDLLTKLTEYFNIQLINLNKILNLTTEIKNKEDIVTSAEIALNTYINQIIAEIYEDPNQYIKVANETIIIAKKKIRSKLDSYASAKTTTFINKRTELNLTVTTTKDLVINLKQKLDIIKKTLLISASNISEVINAAKAVVSSNTSSGSSVVAVTIDTPINNILLNILVKYLYNNQSISNMDELIKIFFENFIFNQSGDIQSGVTQSDVTQLGVTQVGGSKLKEVSKNQKKKKVSKKVSKKSKKVSKKVSKKSKKRL